MQVCRDRSIRKCGPRDGPSRVDSAGWISSVISGSRSSSLTAFPSGRFAAKCTSICRRFQSGREVNAWSNDIYTQKVCAFELGDSKDPFAGATIASLRLRPVTSIPSTSPCSEAIETMRDKGFDQLPVSSPSQKLIGLHLNQTDASTAYRSRATNNADTSSMLGEAETAPDRSRSQQEAAIAAATSFSLRH
ncbi:hypothetical protein EJ06DRAFT_520816 [Trichodelitschia bisporula]|uniref:Uncharacterized protein n=1 Tax=Trichodelitschia bisporula TaxID=703511 RepID=A0A6G1I1D9_9PEZI|nr:hypothetical protein EJ06DRAFT_520816 [Trichodelitschia bisporula]